MRGKFVHEDNRTKKITCFERFYVLQDQSVLYRNVKQLKLISTNKRKPVESKDKYFLLQQKGSCFLISADHYELPNKNMHMN